MSAKKLAVLDVGSDALTLVVQDGRYPNNYIYKGSENYSGYQDGEFLDVQDLYAAVEKLLKACEETAFCRPDDVLVGVPGEFTTVICKTLDLNFTNKKKIGPADLELLFMNGNTYDGHAVFRSINASPVYYICDGGEKIIDPVGIKAAKLTGYISYVLAERTFLDLFDRIAENVGARFEYTSEILAELLYVVPPEERDKGVIIADIGFISSTVAYGKGDGILHSVSFSSGGGNVAGDLTMCMQVPFEHAAELLPKINLNLQPKPADTYTASVRGEAFSYNIKDINEVAYCRVQDIAQTIGKAIAAGNRDIKPSTPIMLTGSGLSQLAGAKEIISAATGRAVKVISADLLQFNRPAQAAIAGLIMVGRRKLPAAGVRISSKFRAYLLKRRRNK
jgi:Actin-like ATPase involved in cell division